MHLDANSLWYAYAAGSDEAREALLNEHLGLVHFVARQLSRSLSSDADFDELPSDKFDFSWCRWSSCSSTPR